MRNKKTMLIASITIIFVLIGLFAYTDGKDERDHRRKVTNQMVEIESRLTATTSQVEACTKVKTAQFAPSIFTKLQMQKNTKSCAELETFIDWVRLYPVYPELESVKNELLTLADVIDGYQDIAFDKAIVVVDNETVRELQIRYTKVREELLKARQKPGID